MYLALIASTSQNSIFSFLISLFSSLFSLFSFLFSFSLPSLYSPVYYLCPECRLLTITRRRVQLLNFMPKNPRKRSPLRFRRFYLDTWEARWLSLSVLILIFDKDQCGICSYVIRYIVGSADWFRFLRFANSKPGSNRGSSWGANYNCCRIIWSWR